MSEDAFTHRSKDETKNQQDTQKSTIEASPEEISEKDTENTNKPSIEEYNIHKKEDKTKEHEEIIEIEEGEEENDSEDLFEEENNKRNISHNEPEEEENYEEIKEQNQSKMQGNNLIEEASEILDQCIKCGMCKGLCPVFKIIREEKISPRGHSILLQEKIVEESFFKCNLCKACEKKCPLDLKICDAVLKAREALVLKERGLKENEEMIKNIRETGNPFGKNPDKDGKLYCC